MWLFSQNGFERSSKSIIIKDQNQRLFYEIQWNSCILSVTDMSKKTLETLCNIHEVQMLVIDQSNIKLYYHILREFLWLVCLITVVNVQRVCCMLSLWGLCRSFKTSLKCSNLNEAEEAEICLMITHVHVI